MLLVAGRVAIEEIRIYNAFDGRAASDLDHTHTAGFQDVAVGAGVVGHRLSQAEFQDEGLLTAIFDFKAAELQLAARDLERSDRAAEFFDVGQIDVLIDDFEAEVLEVTDVQFDWTDDQQVVLTAIVQ